LIIAVVALLGLGRVWMSVQAAEASLRSSELRKSIKSARYEGDMLEIRLSALGSPSRVKAIATTSLGMTEARKVTYLDVSEFIDDIAGHRPTPSSSASRPRPTGANRALADVLDLAATEAQILLVGDVSLVSAR
jgi:cell division protein FtsL